MYDLLIRNAQLLDGSGQPAFRGDLAIEQERITAIAISPPQTLITASTHKVISSARV